MKTNPPSVLLHKRSAEGLLADLWELPNTVEADPLADALCSGLLKKLLAALLMAVAAAWLIIPKQAQVVPSYEK